MKRMLCWLKNVVLYMFFPNKCIFCEQIIGLHGSCCAGCVDKLPYVRHAICPRCAKDVCVCSRESFAFDRTVVPFYYTGAVRQAILRFKFSECMHYARPLAEYMARELAICQEAAEASYITYMPATRRTIRRRGYNQAQLLAEELSRLTGIPCTPLAKKTRETKQQHDLDAKARRKNVKGAFTTIGKTDLREQTVIVCDDVMTTGASMHELARVLKRAGVKAVIACVTATTKEQI